MSLFGEKCARCGARTHHEVEGRPMCDNCEKETGLMLQAEGESSRPCPVDGEMMKKEIAHMIVIDRCPKCQGVWLDSGELERIKGGVEAQALMAMANGFTVPFS